MHATRSKLELDPTLAVLLLDIKNAFNEADRSFILAQVALHFPEILGRVVLWIPLPFGL